jgi:hypothetical protein
MSYIVLAASTYTLHTVCSSRRRAGGLLITCGGGGGGGNGKFAVFTVFAKGPSPLCPLNTVFTVLVDIRCGCASILSPLYAIAVVFVQGGSSLHLLAHSITLVSLALRFGFAREKLECYDISRHAPRMLCENANFLTTCAKNLLTICRTGDLLIDMNITVSYDAAAARDFFAFNKIQCRISLCEQSAENILHSVSNTSYNRC